MNNEYKNNTSKKATNYVLPESASELNISTLESNTFNFNKFPSNLFISHISNINKHIFSLNNKFFSQKFIQFS